MTYKNLCDLITNENYEYLDKDMILLDKDMI